MTLNEKLDQRLKSVKAVNESTSNVYTLYRDMKDFKKYLDREHRNHPGYSRERKDAIDVVIDLLRELTEG